jgi:hypothetical protein
MTEEQWLSCTDPDPMLNFLRGKVSDRKLRLFAVACCRHIWHLLKDERVEKAVTLSEKVADGTADSSQLQVLLAGLQETANGYPPVAMAYKGTMVAIIITLATPGPPLFNGGLYSLANAMAWNADPGATVVEDEWAGERKEQARLLHAVIANPFRPVALDPAWLTPPVVSIARRAYDDRDYQALPVLADALEEAGCTNKDILAHCRGPGEHVRGCWVVDLVLGKG